MAEMLVALCRIYLDQDSSSLREMLSFTIGQLIGSLENKKDALRCGYYFDS